MTIILNISNSELFDKILWFLNRFRDDGLEIITTTNREIEGNKFEKKNKFSEFAGIWKDRDISLESIRKQAWR